MTPIEHFQIDVIQILFRGWIENTIAYIGSCEASNDIFQTTLRKLFYKCWLIIFFHGSGCSFVRCCRKIYNVGRLGFFVRAQPKLCFSRHRHVFIYSARKTFAHLGKKHYSPVLIEKNPSRHRQQKFTDRGLKINHLVTSFEHFQIDIIQILFRDWIDKTTATISR